MVMFTLMLPTVIVPLVGLGIDVTMLYIVQAKLSAAVDAAALGAGRLLGTQADPAEITGEFLKANFQTKKGGFWGADNLKPTVKVTLGTTKKIHIDASVEVPLLFSRIFGQPKAMVTASGESTRRDSRLVVVIDRSGSMNTTDHQGSTVIADVLSYTQTFVQRFTPGTDELGLVVFDASGVVAYPSVRPWDPTTTATSTGGPNTSFLDGSSTDMVHMIQAVQAGGGTGMAEALWLAYIELQKTHLRDLAAKGVDDRLNSILLFTDGAPTAVTLYLNNGALNTTNNALKSSSTCTYKNGSPTQKMLGWFAVGGSAPYAGTNGMSILASLDTSHTALWWMSNVPMPSPNQHLGDGAYTNTTAPFSNWFAGCGNTLFDNIDQSTTDLRQIPPSDAYGNSLITGLYTNSQIVGDKNATSVWTGPMLQQSQPTSAYNWGLAIWNSVDNAAKRIRQDVNLANRIGDSQNMGVAIYTIGYTGNGGVDEGLLKRVANDKAAAGYDGTQPTGEYIPASDKNALANAFDTMASIILRLSQ
jgi:hypothetical protein